MRQLPVGARNAAGVCDMDLAQVPYAWIAQLVQRVYWYGKTASHFDLPAPILLKMSQLCFDCRNALGHIEMMLTAPLPFPYVHLVSLLVHFSALFACLKVGLLLGTAPTDPSTTGVFFQLLFILAMNGLYSGLLCLS